MAEVGLYCAYSSFSEFTKLCRKLGARRWPPDILLMSSPLHQHPYNGYNHKAIKIDIHVVHRAQISDNTVKNSRFVKIITAC